MKSQDLFSLKNKKKIKLSSAVVVIGTLRFGATFIFLGLRESLSIIYDFSSSGKIKFAFQFLFLSYVPALQI